MRETTWMETNLLYWTRIPWVSAPLSLYEGNYLNGNTSHIFTYVFVYFVSLPLWGKLLEWKREPRVEETSEDSWILSLYEGNYLNGNS